MYMMIMLMMVIMDNDNLTFAITSLITLYIYINDLAPMLYIDHLS